MQTTENAIDGIVSSTTENRGTIMNSLGGSCNCLTDISKPN
ncbi:hypothetical protein [Aquimarina addita]